MLMCLLLGMVTGSVGGLASSSMREGSDGAVLGYLGACLIAVGGWYYVVRMTTIPLASAGLVWDLAYAFGYLVLLLVTGHVLHGLQWLGALLAIAGMVLMRETTS